METFLDEMPTVSSTLEFLSEQELVAKYQSNQLWIAHMHSTILKNPHDQMLCTQVTADIASNETENLYILDLLERFAH